VVKISSAINAASVLLQLKDVLDQALDQDKKEPLYDKNLKKRKITKKRTKKKKYDPDPPPIDIKGKAGQLVRLVPEVEQLIEGRIELPPKKWNEVAAIVQDFEGIEIDFSEGRIIRRGRINKATNLFIDRG
jgi:hypothetical protein